MRLWRISEWPGLGGEGGLYADGRWNPLGVRVVYASEHPALSLIETLVHLHLKLARGSIPTTLKLIALDIDDGATISNTPALPSGWQANEPTTQAIGGAWLQANADLLLPVPSALIAHATNYLINPAHTQAVTHVREVTIEPVWIDKRFLR